MSTTMTSPEKVLDNDQLLAQIAEWRAMGHRIIFTNGCFDILHIGHITLLEQCRQYGDKLIVAINSDASVQSRNAQWPESASSLLDVHALHWRREITARRHPVPEFVEIVCQVPFKLFDRQIVESGCTPVRLYPFISIPSIRLRNAPRLCFIQRAPPVAG
jgi:cytidyltransferase-like protein